MNSETLGSEVRLSATKAFDFHADHNGIEITPEFFLNKAPGRPQVVRNDKAAGCEGECVERNLGVLDVFFVIEDVVKLRLRLCCLRYYLHDVDGTLDLWIGPEVFPDCAQQMVEQLPFLPERPDPQAREVCASPALKGVGALRKRPGAEKAQPSCDHGCDRAEVNRETDAGARHGASQDCAECPQTYAEAEWDDEVRMIDKPCLPGSVLVCHSPPRDPVDNHLDRLVSRIVPVSDARDFDAETGMVTVLL